jgi:chromosomal replication initiation ATPase DnaA
MKKEIFKQYLNAIVKMYGIERSELLSNSKKRTVADARLLLYYLCHIRPMRYSEIQAYMKEEGYDPQHTPIIQGVKRIAKKIESDVDYQVVVDRIKNKVFI